MDERGFVRGWIPGQFLGLQLVLQDRKPTLIKALDSRKGFSEHPEPFSNTSRPPWPSPPKERPGDNVLFEGHPQRQNGHSRGGLTETFLTMRGCDPALAAIKLACAGDDKNGYRWFETDL